MFVTIVIVLGFLGRSNESATTQAHGGVPQIAAATEPEVPNDGNNLYLAAARDDILRHLVYPARARHLEGIAQYGLLVDRRGRLLQVQLTQSSGKGVLDKAGMDMIRRSAPIRPLPADITGNPVNLVLTVHFTP